MDNRAAKELLHIRDWSRIVTLIVDQGDERYLEDLVLQQAGDALMMRIGEAANRLSRLDDPDLGHIDWISAIDNRNFLIHQYQSIDRHESWLTLSRSLPAWLARLQPLFRLAEHKLEHESI